MKIKIGMVVSIKEGSHYTVLWDNGEFEKVRARASTSKYLVVATIVGDTEVGHDTVLRNMSCGTNVYADNDSLINPRAFCPNCKELAPYCSSCGTVHCSCGYKG